MLFHGFLVIHSELHFLFVCDSEFEDLSVPLWSFAALTMGSALLDLRPDLDLNERTHFAEHLCTSS